MRPFLFICLLFFSTISNASQSCIIISDKNNPDTIALKLNNEACFEYKTIESPGYIDINFYSEVNLNQINIEDGDTKLFYEIGEGITKFGFSSDFSKLKFSFPETKQSSNLVISASVDYERELPRLSFIVTRNSPGIEKSEDIKVLARAFIKPMLNTQSKASSENCDVNNTSPIAPPIKDASLHGNIDRLDFLSHEFSYPGLVLFFKHQVNNKGQWDFKQQGSKYANYGNYHYGVMGMSIGIPKQVLLRMAGWAQIQAGTSKKLGGII